MKEHYIDKSTNQISDKLSEKAREFLLNESGTGKIPPEILDELTEYRKINEARI